MPPKRRKKKKKSRPPSAAVSSSNSKSANPFDSHGTVRLKQRVLNKRVKGVNRNPKARLEANLKRKKSLLLELQNQTKQNKFVDRRFGENEQISQEEKDFLRFQRERQRRSRSKNSRFSLQDTTELTHLGSSLSDTKHYADVVAEDDDDDELLDSKTIDDLTRIGSGKGQKTKKEILAEIVAKDKAEKARKKELAMEQANLLETLNESLKDIRQYVEFKDTRSKMDKLLGRKPSEDKQDEDDANGIDEFRAATRQLASDMRARAAERLKTPEELAQEQKERLEKLEAERLKRMNPDNYKDDTGENKVAPTDDDIVLNYADAKAPSLRKSLKAKAIRMKSKNEDEGVEYRHSEEAIEAAIKAKKELPYIFKAPSDHAKFRELLDQHCKSSADLAEIVNRICIYNSVALTKENKPKLQQFLGVLLDHFNYIFDKASTQSTGNKVDFQKLKEASVLSPLIHELCAQLPRTAGNEFRTRISAVRNKYIGGKSALDFTYPSVSELYFMQLAISLFPVSDFKHNVTVPMIHLLTQMLRTLPIHGGRDFIAALFICRLLLICIRDSRRYIPELVGFVDEAFDVGFQQAQHSSRLPLVFPTGSKIAGVWAAHAFVRTSSSNNDATPSPFCRLMSTNNNADFEDHGFQEQSLGLLVATAVELVNSYKDLETFPEQFSRMCASVKSVLKRTEKKSKSFTIPLMKSLVSLIDESSDACLGNRLPLVLRKEKPKQIKQFNPAIIDGFQPGKDNDPNKDRAEMKKLKKRLKREKKHAMRALQRDSAFVARERQKHMRQKLAEKGRKMKRVRSEMEKEWADTNVHSVKSKRKK